MFNPCNMKSSILSMMTGNSDLEIAAYINFQKNVPSVRKSDLYRIQILNMINKKGLM